MENLVRFLEEESAQPLSRCFQCKKCSAGCPVGGIADLQTNEVIRLAQLGAAERLLQSNRLWLCLSCKTCQARCPNGIDCSAIIDVLKNMVLRAGAVPGENKIPNFYRSFLDSVRMTGRLYELGMIGLYKMRTGTYGDDMGLGIKMLKRGKLKILPEWVKRRGQVRAIFEKAGGKQ
jgi:heterodisulfide reductase subunit C/quinone-modifying oxidoreductase subunit QmoC